MPLLALIIEKVSGLSYADFMSQDLFPAFADAGHLCVYDLSDSAKAMTSYYQTGRPFRMEFLDLVYGDKNIYSTVRDMYKWDQALRSGQLFSKGVLDSAYSGYSFEKPGQRNYGLGWRMLMIPNGKKLIYHNGWWHGNRTVFIRMLDENATIIALSNNDYKNVYSAKRLLSIFSATTARGMRSFDEGGESADSANDPGRTAASPASEIGIIKADIPPSPHPPFIILIHHPIKKAAHPQEEKGSEAGGLIRLRRN
jgi:CubicO group peptidase (beta-lactamase class C family)